MPVSDPVTDGVSIVLTGALNPLIFQPAWFAARKLLRPEEGESANVEIIHPEVVSFDTDWLKLQVTRNRFAAHTSLQNSYEVLRDLVVGTFKLLSHTPLESMGLNWEGHFQLPTEEAWHSFGDRLAPKSTWDGVMTSPRTLSLSMKGERSEAHDPGFVVMKVEGSSKIQPNGVFISVNDHFSGSPPRPGNSACEEFIEILNSTWARSVERSRAMATKLVESAG